uniref:Uncharacterized protein n=1 Tax=Brassica oleracea TaxID=3712 RepID=A0A3P6DXE8_BRAOL|nr:unnamed protein product [Brassica oleracea]
MLPMITGFMNYGQQTLRAARYIGQGFMITLSHTNRLPVTIQYPYEKLITSERFQVVESISNLINALLVKYVFEYVL